MTEYRPSLRLVWTDGHEETFYLGEQDSWQLDRVAGVLRFKRGQPQIGRTEVPIENLRYWEVYPRL